MTVVGNDVFFDGCGLSSPGEDCRVLLDPSMTLIDFGSAIRGDGDYWPKIVTTAPYRAPEVMLERRYSYPCDIWSVACVLTELYSGEMLFRLGWGDERLALMELVFEQKFDPVLLAGIKRDEFPDGIPVHTLAVSQL